MADCCAELRSELAALRAEVAKLKPVDKEAIILEAVERSKKKLLPLIDQALAIAKTAKEFADAAYKLAKTAEALAKAAEGIAKAAKAAADALQALVKLIPFIPTLIALCAIAGLIFGFAARLASAEFRIDILDNGLTNLDSTVGRLINIIARLQQAIANLRLQPGPKGDKGDRGLNGSPGYTPIKGRDYQDGLPGKDGYTPVKGKDYRDGLPGKDGYAPVKGKDYKDGIDGKPGYTPVKGKDYQDGLPGKDGYAPVKGKDYQDGIDGKSIKGDRGEPGQSIKGDRGQPGQSIKGDRGEPGQSIKGDRGEPGKSIKGDRGEPGKSIKGDKGDAEMPTNLNPVLNAIANLTNKVNKCNSDSDKDRVRLDAIYKAVNIELAGVINSTRCNDSLDTFAYTGLGFVGLQGQLNCVANQIAKVHEDICTQSYGNGGGRSEPDDLIQKIYQILGGEKWFEGSEDAPGYQTDGESDIKTFGNAIFGENSDQLREVGCTNLVDLINIATAVNYQRLGLNEYPASLPTSLINSDEGFIGNIVPNVNLQIHNLTRFISWYVERFDEIMGQWEIPIEIKDSDPSKPGEQPIGLKLPNMAEAIAEMFTLIFQTNINSETALNLAIRNVSETVADKQQNFISYKLLQSLTDWVGFKQKDINLKMPLSITLNKTRYDEILKESEVDVGVVEFDDKFGLEADLMRFREAAAILQATHKKKLDPNGDIKAQILKYLLDTFKATEKVNGKDDEQEFEDFLKEVETGFINTAGINDAVNPYGRPFTQRPRIRDLTKYEPPKEP